jgi:hypothetical protein
MNSDMLSNANGCSRKAKATNMKEKEMYTFEELCSNLEISMSQFCKRSNTDAGTIARIRQGELTRLSTANRLLRAFSEVYERELSLDNVEGLRLQNAVVRKPTRVRVETSRTIDIHADTTAQISHTVRHTGSAPKSDIPTDLPSGTIKLFDFIKQHGLSGSNISKYVSSGFKGEKIETTQRPRPSSSGVQHFLTPTQQEKALDFLRRHGKLKKDISAEKPVAEDTLWYLPDE